MLTHADPYTIMVYGSACCCHSMLFSIMYIILQGLSKKECDRFPVLRFLSYQSKIRQLKKNSFPVFFKMYMLVQIRIELDDQCVILNRQ